MSPSDSESPTSDLRPESRESAAPESNPNVVVAMSGGVDSSVAAALCLAAGHDVSGVMLKLWSEAGSDAPNRCCSPESVADAQAVARKLGIPFALLDMEAAFRDLVVDRFIEELAAGRTPNPCFACNREVRFGEMLKWVVSTGGDYLATGHYARVDRAADGRYRLLRGTDSAKDQSYMLHRLGQKELARAIFPLGGLEKKEVRELARQMGLPSASRPDSVDLCWVGEDGLSGFLERHLAEGVAQRGPIVDLEGRELGEHSGLPHYTVGQRRGLGVSTGQAVYVVRLDASANRLVVGPLEAASGTTVRARRFNWVSGVAPRAELRVEAQVRYRSEAAPASLVPLGDDEALVEFDEPQWAPTPGQGLAVYVGEECLGGGTIWTEDE